MTLALVTLLRLVVAPCTESAAARPSSANVQKLAKALNVSVCDAEPLASLDTAAIRATESESPCVAVKYILYEADTGCSNARMLENKEYWMERAWQSRRGLEETFWVIQRRRMGPFEGQIVNPATLPRLLDDAKEDDGRGVERGRGAAEVPRRVRAGSAFEGGRGRYDHDAAEAKCGAEHGATHGGPDVTAMAAPRGGAGASPNCGGRAAGDAPRVVGAPRAAAVRKGHHAAAVEAKGQLARSAVVRASDSIAATHQTRIHRSPWHKIE